MIYSSRAGLMGIVHSLLLKSLPLLYHRFNQGSAFDNTLLWWTPLTFSSARRNSPQEDIFYNAEVAFHLRRKEQSNRCIFHVEVLTVLRMPDGLPENAMLPEHGRSIKAREKLVHFIFQGEEFRI